MKGRHIWEDRNAEPEKGLFENGGLREMRNTVLGSGIARRWNSGSDREKSDSTNMEEGRGKGEQAESHLYSMQSLGITWETYWRRGYMEKDDLF